MIYNYKQRKYFCQPVFRISASKNGLFVQTIIIRWAKIMHFASIIQRYALKPAYRFWLFFLSKCNDLFTYLPFISASVWSYFVQYTINKHINPYNKSKSIYSLRFAYLFCVFLANIQKTCIMPTLTQSLLCVILKREKRYQ